MARRPRIAPCRLMSSGSTTKQLRPSSTRSQVCTRRCHDRQPGRCGLEEDHAERIVERWEGARVGLGANARQPGLVDKPAPVDRDCQVGRPPSKDGLFGPSADAISSMSAPVERQPCRAGGTGAGRRQGRVCREAAGTDARRARSVGGGGRADRASAHGQLQSTACTTCLRDVSARAVPRPVLPDLPRQRRAAPRTTIGSMTSTTGAVACWARAAISSTSHAGWWACYPIGSAAHWLPSPIARWLPDRASR
jgi:hypothetical protein